MATAATSARPSDVNDALREAARESPEAATFPAYLLWSGETWSRSAAMTPHLPVGLFMAR